MAPWRNAVGTKRRHATAAPDDHPYEDPYDDYDDDHHDLKEDWI